jgi:hypothetical protein
MQLKDCRSETAFSIVPVLPVLPVLPQLMLPLLLQMQRRRMEHSSPGSGRNLTQQPCGGGVGTIKLCIPHAAALSPATTVTAANSQYTAACISHF